MNAPRSVEYDIRVDGLEKVTGAARYASDVARSGMLYAKALRSPLPHGRIVGVDVNRARGLPGAHAVLTADDLPAHRLGRSMRDMPILARERVRFVGEKIAAVAADTPELAEEALGLIEVTYEELPAVFDPVEAMQPGAPLVHDPHDVRAWKTPKQIVADYPNCVSNPVFGASTGEVERALAEARHVFEHTFRTPVQHQGYIEPHACLVDVDKQGRAHIWASNKAPFLLLDYLREGVGLRRDELELHLLPLGGDFGGKGSFMDIPLAYFLSRASGRPVKMVMTYAEELQAANPRHAAAVTVKSGFDEYGKLIARWTRIVYNSGAYAAFKPALDATLPRVRSGGLGAYGDVPVWRVEGHMVYTNTVPCGHMRAPGGAQPIHAIECHMDLCARAMGMDPLELRLINAPRSPRVTPSGEDGSRPQACEVLQAAAEAIGLLDSRPDGVGRGIALVDVANSPATDYTAAMIVERSGRIVLGTPIIEQGSGMLTAFRQMVGEAFSVSLDGISIEQTMEGIEYDRGVGGSRITRIVGKMIGVLAERVQARLASLVAAEFGHEPAQVAVVPGGFRTPDGRFLTVGEAASLAETDVAEVLRYEPRPEDSVETFTAIAAEVHVDRETGQVDVSRAVTAHEVGRVINRTMHQGQIEGGLAQGLGYALMEGLRFEDGRVVTGNLHEYKLPTAADMPALQTIRLDPDLSLGITPIGEGPNCAASAAVVNAIVDVVAHQVDIPVTSEALLGQE